jgi:putative phosphoesterase
MNKIAIISDIHGNKWALKTVLKDIKKRGIKKIFNLGDSLYGPLDPIGTFELISKKKIISISGNEDRLILENVNKKFNNPTLKYILETINDDIIKWIKKLPKYRIINSFFMCHGTPQKDNEYLLEKINKNNVEIKSKSELKNTIDSIKQDVILCGHSHIQNIIRISPNKLIINPGSIGLPAYKDNKPIPHKMESGNQLTRYTIIIKKDSNYDIHNVMLSYNYEKAIELAKQNNRNDWAKWLKTGKC